MVTLVIISYLVRAEETILMGNLLDFYQHVGDAEGERPRQVDQDKRVHAGQQHTAQTWNDAAQTAGVQTIWISVIESHHQ